MKASVIVTAWNETPQQLKKTIEGIHLSKNHILETVVLVNKYEEYPEKTKQVLNLISGHPHITRWASISQNIGVARSWNVGVQMCEGNIYVILNGDCVPGAGAIEKLIEPFSNPFIGIVGYGGVKDGRKVNSEGLCEGVHGACFAIKKNVYEEIGGIDNNFSPLADEAELCARIWGKGYGAYIAEGVDVTHKCRISEKPHQDIIYFGRKIDRAELDQRNNNYKIGLPWLGRVSYKKIKQSNKK